MDDLQKIIAVARGESPADLVLVGGQLVNVFSGEIQRCDLAVLGGRIAALGAGFSGHREIDLAGAFVAPAFMDAHIHLESSQLTPDQFARVVVPRGTTAAFCDPHEMANVLGLDGVRYLLRATENLPLDLYFMAPSCVPATDLETSGASLDPDDIASLLLEPRVLGLAEMMNFPGVINRDPGVLAKLKVAAGGLMDGHAPGLTGPDLSAYRAAGITSDHECVTADEARAKLAVGMHIMLRDGSSARNLADLVAAWTPENSHCWLLCTDDKTPEDLLGEGHVDHLIRRAIEAGVPPMDAIRMATLNTARYFGLADRGALLPGYRADLVVFDSWDELTVSRVWKGGELVAEDGALLAEPESVASPSHRITLGKLPENPFAVADPGTRLIRVIEAFPDQLLTGALELEPVRRDGVLIADPDRDLLKLAVVERHTGSGRVGLGFIRGFGLERGALATTVAHDSHNILIVGASDRAMELALETIVRMGGGKVAVTDDRVLAVLPLPVAGLMSPDPAEVVAAAGVELAAAARALGSSLPAPLMTLSFMALPVIPELKLTDRGLVDVSRFEIVPLGIS
jgi:adenine deaminase